MMRKNWFTIERLERDTYVISEYKHWEETHCYLLLGQTSAILIDAGLGVADFPACSSHHKFAYPSRRHPCPFRPHRRLRLFPEYRRPPAGGALAQWPIPSEPPDGAGKQPFAQTLRLSAGI